MVDAGDSRGQMVALGLAGMAEQKTPPFLKIAVCCGSPSYNKEQGSTGRTW